MLGVLASMFDGVLVGCVYGLAAMGLSLVWGVMNVINLAHGIMIAFGMFGLYFLFSSFGRQSLPAAAADHHRRIHLRRGDLLGCGQPRDWSSHIDQPALDLCGEHDVARAGHHALEHQPL